VIPVDFLLTVLVVEMATVGVCLTAVALHALGLWHRTQADAPLLVRGRAALSKAIAGDPDANEGVAELRRLPSRVQSEVVDQLAVSVTGEEGRRMTGVAEALGLAASARRRCRSRWWWRRLQGAYRLNVHGGGDEALPALFRDPHPAVRAQVIEWAGDAQRADLAADLVAALHDSSALCRHTAADSILRGGASMVDALAEELSSYGGQQQADLLVVLARRPDPRYRRAALAAVADDLPALRVAVADLLGGVGGAEASEALLGLLTDPDAAVRAAAADGIRRLRLEDAVPSLAPLLRDESFEVRRAAGAALAGVGPGGILLLRHYRSDADPFAADMANHSLDIASLRHPGDED